MNFSITRQEILALTGISRTDTFALQKAGKLVPLAGASGKRRYQLCEVLACASTLYGGPPQDDRGIEIHAEIVVRLRLAKLGRQKPLA